MEYKIYLSDKEYKILFQGLCEAVDWNIENKQLDKCDKYYGLMKELYKQTGIKYTDNVHDCTTLYYE